MYEAAGTGSKNQVQLLAFDFVLVATEGTLPSYSLVSLTIRKSKKDNQIELGSTALTLGPLAVPCKLASLTLNWKNICALALRQEVTGTLLLK